MWGLLILATTTQRSVLQQLDLFDCFDRELAVPNVTNLDELSAVLQEVRAFESSADLAESLNTLRDIAGSDKVGVGIKRVLLGVETARQTPDDIVGRFADVMSKMMHSREV
jgi:vesicle-fusing ATPase